jgi:PAS domain S-box-containing protein
LDLQRDHFLDFYEQAPLGFLTCDWEGRVQHLNRTAAGMLGLERQDGIGAAFPALVHPREVSEFWAFLRRVRAGEGAWVTTELRLGPGSRSLVVQVHGLAVSGSQGAEGLRLALTDVTQRKEAEALQQRANRALRALNAVNHAVQEAEDETSLLDQVCCFLTAEAGYALAWVGSPIADDNGSIRYLAGAGVTRYLDRVWDKMTWADHGRGRGPFGQAVASGRPAIHPNLETDPAFGPWQQEALDHDLHAVIALPLRDEDRVIGVLGIYSTDSDAFHDEEMRWLTRLADDLATAWVSLRLRAERRRIERERDRLVEILDATPELVGMIDPDGRIRYCNPGGKRMRGLDPDADVADRYFGDCFPQWALERLRQEAFPCAREQGIWRGETALLDGEGRELPVAQALVAHYGEAGEVERFSTIAHDLQPFRGQRAELDRHRRLMALGELGSILAHQLNQPLSAAANYIEGSLERLKAIEAVSPALGEALRQGLEEVHRAGEVVRNVRNFLRGEPPHFQELDLNALILRLVPGLTRDQNGPDFRPQVDLEEVLPPVAADAILVQECLLNLVYNAAEASAAEGGEPAPVVVRTRTHPEGAEVQVEDCGHGLPEPLRQNLDRPLYTTKADGMGLGLSICRSVVEAHGGHLWATENAPPPGTTFHFTLPSADIGEKHDRRP